MTEAAANEIITVREFAQRYRVDDEVIRLWIRNGQVPYRMVDGTHMVRVGDVVKPNPVTHPDTDRAVNLLMTRDGMDEETARSVVTSLHADEIAVMLAEEETISGRNDEVPVGGEEEGAGANPVGTGRPAKVKKVKGRGRRTP